NDNRGKSRSHQSPTPESPEPAAPASRGAYNAPGGAVKRKPPPKRPPGRRSSPADRLTKDLSDAILLPDAGLFAPDVARVFLGVTRSDWCWSAGSRPPTSIATSRICGTSVRDFCSRVRERPGGSSRPAPRWRRRWIALKGARRPVRWLRSSRGARNPLGCACTGGAAPTRPWRRSGGPPAFALVPCDRHEPRRRTRARTPARLPRRRGVDRMAPLRAAGGPDVWPVRRDRRTL